MNTYLAISTLVFYYMSEQYTGISELTPTTDAYNLQLTRTMHKLI